MRLCCLNRYFFAALKIAFGDCETEGVFFFFFFLARGSSSVKWCVEEACVGLFEGLVADVKEALCIAVKLYSFKTLGPFSAASTMATTKKVQFVHFE